jgi:hypothetical protein
MHQFVYSIENDIINGVYGELSQFLEKINTDINLTRLIDFVLEKIDCSDLIKPNLKDDYGNLCSRTMVDLKMFNNIKINLNIMELTINKKINLVDHEDSGSEPMMVGGLFALKINSSVISIEILSECGYCEINNSEDILLFLKEAFTNLI